MGRGKKKIGIIPRNKNLLYIHPRIKAVPDPTPGLYQNATLNNQEIRNKMKVRVDTRQRWCISLQDPREKSQKEERKMTEMKE
jgi:transcriptional regulatory protein LevR